MFKEPPTVHIPPATLQVIQSGRRWSTTQIYSRDSETGKTLPAAYLLTLASLDELLAFTYESGQQNPNISFAAWRRQMNDKALKERELQKRENEAKQKTMVIPKSGDVPMSIRKPAPQASAKLEEPAPPKLPSGNAKKAPANGLKPAAGYANPRYSK